MPAGQTVLTVGLLLAILLASGCSRQTILVDHPASPWAVQVKKLQTIRSWQIKARMAVRSRRKGGQATVRWKRINDQHELDLYGPFGSGRMLLRQNTDQATLIDSKNNRFTGRSLQQLLYRRVGWPVPFSSLQYWIIGLPAPGTIRQQQWDEQGRLSRLQQNGWKIQFSEYRKVDRYELPGRLQLDALPGTIPAIETDPSWLEDRPGGLEQPLFRIKLIIRNWQLPETTAPISTTNQ
ncbi:MAG TPA: outer membrane lipoprotein LolB [Gammaproteobacteria bacterium]|mgnify:CR=1 FL=1|nr:outer membrane lipoprotein LolB [Gammaproteobacteria bacterium]